MATSHVYSDPKAILEFLCDAEYVKDGKREELTLYPAKDNYSYAALVSVPSGQSGLDQWLQKKELWIQYGRGSNLDLLAQIRLRARGEEITVHKIFQIKDADIDLALAFMPPATNG